MLERVELHEATRLISLPSRLLAVGLLLLCLLPEVVWSQAFAPVRGKIVAADATPLVGALVELTGAGGSARSSATGEFLLPRVPLGRQVLRVRMVGYQMKLQAILVEPDSGWTGTITLETWIRELPEIEVTSSLGKPPEFAHTSKYDDYFRRRKLGFGTFRTRADIEKKASLDLVSVLQGIPGVRIYSTHNPHGETEVRFQMARCQPPKIAFYINGQRIALFLKDPGQTSPVGNESDARVRGEGIRSTCDDCVKLAEAFSSVLLREIEFIEFYRGPGQIPSDLDRGDVCSALVVWTR